ncbi:hypothetical protein BDV09DRAFT_168924 [Aspergillus tetrazonus]
MFKQLSSRQPRSPDTHFSTSSQDPAWKKETYNADEEVHEGSTISSTKTRRSLSRHWLPFRSSSRRRSPSPETQSKFGLHVVHRPETIAPVNIVFVHGLGGDRILTWCKHRDKRLYWPEKWLKQEQSIGRCRILSFGYDASFGMGAVKSIYRISDFAKSLLHDMKFGQDSNGNPLGLGKVPTVFVAHSMGGLVVKAAYLLGQNDETYKEVVQSIGAIIFLATPHRGADSAATLNNLLRASFLSSKSFIAELQRGSPALEDINEQFRHIAPKLLIASFYESLATKIGIHSAMIVIRDSATLGYQQEISRELHADHHDVCKYSSPQDANYTSVRNTLASFIAQLQARGIDVINDLMAEESRKIEKLLLVTSKHEEEFETLCSWWLEGTCDWIFDVATVKNWLKDEEEVEEVPIVQFKAPPASGKSVLSAYLVRELRSRGHSVLYFFFRSEDSDQRTVSFFLRSTALQLASVSPAYKEKLLHIAIGGHNVMTSSSTDVFRKLFQFASSGVDFPYPLYWIVDAVDESESAKTVLEYISRIRQVIPSLKVLFTSRESVTFPADQKIATFSASAEGKGSVRDNSLDIRIYLERMMHEMGGKQDLKDTVMQAILRRAQGNFLWVRLVVKEILSCHTEEGIETALQSMPKDMDQLYERMECVVLSAPRAEDKEIAQMILQWVVCSRFPMTTEVLNQALNKKFIDLRKTISQVCGQFVMVDPSGQVRLIHETAREYLTRTTASPIAIRLPRSHYLLFEQTLSALLAPDIRQKVIRAQESLSVSEPFLLYAATSWMYHLQQSAEINDQAIDHLSRFFRTTSVLVWIHMLSITDQLDRLVRAAKIVTDSIKAYRKSNMTKNPLLHKLSDLELLERWSADLLKIVGKFSRQLMIHPTAIYSQIPPLCPSSSAIYEQFYQQDFADIKILGISQTDWNDNLARIPLPRGEEGIKLCCFGRYVAVLTSSGRVTIWDANHFKQVCSLVHQEAVTSMSFNRYGTKMLTFGLVTSRLWSIPSGELLATVVNPANTRALSVTFRETDRSVLVACTNRVIYSLDLEDLAAGWRMLSRSLLQERSEMGGAIVNSPRCISFNGDASQVGVSYRGFPLSVWDLNEMRCIARCRRPTRTPSKPESAEVTWFAVDRFTWNPVTGHIIGLYKDGTVFKWHPATNEYQEASSSADEVAASPDGGLFVTSSSNGTVKVWSFEYLSVIYQLSSGDLVSELAFAPDSRRFYDIRGSLLNAWQSSSLLRFLEVDEAFSDTSSQDQRSTSFSHISEAHTMSYGAVSVIRASPEHGLYCAGNEEGIVTLFDEKSEKLGKILEFPNFVSISCLAWSNDSGYVAGADLAGDIEIRKLTKVKTTGNGLSQVQSVPQSKPVLKKDGSPICDLLFSHDSTLLLIISGLSAYIWSVEEGCVMIEKQVAETSTQIWANHPTQPETLLKFADNGITGFRWSDFSEIATALYDGLSPRSEATCPKLKGVRFNQNGKLATLHQTDITGVERLFIVDISALQLNKPGSTSSIVRLSTIVPADVARQVEVVLGILPGSRLFFLDKNLWLCSVFLNSSEDTFERHYFLPRDWTTTQYFQQCLLLENGTLLCPREDGVAVIKSELSRSY